MKNYRNRKKQVCLLLLTIIGVGVFAASLSHIQEKQLPISLVEFNIEALSMDEEFSPQRYADYEDRLVPNVTTHLVVYDNGEWEYKDTIIDYTHIVKCSNPCDYYGIYCQQPFDTDIHTNPQSNQCGIKTWYLEEVEP